MSTKINPQVCPECKKLCAWFTGDICQNCFRKFHWKRKLKECPRCKRQMPIHARGFCRGCYMSLFHMEAVRMANVKKLYNVEYEEYQRITSKCAVCGFSNIVSLHHINKNKEDTSENNLVGLCPNHHAMIHHRKYQEEIISILREKGYTLQPLIKIMPIEPLQTPITTETKTIKISHVQIIIQKTEEPEHQENSPNQNFQGVQKPQFLTEPGS